MKFGNIFRKLTLALLLLTGIASAEKPPLTMSEAVHAALQNNRNLRVARLENERAKARIRWAGLLENPQLDLSLNDDFIGEGEGEGSYSIAFSQAFPITSRLNDGKKLSEFQLTLADIEIAEASRFIAFEVEQSIIQLTASQRKKAQLVDLINLNQEIIDFLRLQVSRGEASALDVAQATINGNSIKQKLRAAEAEQRRFNLMLNQAMGLEADASVRIEFSLSLPDQSPNQRIPTAQLLGQRPDYQLALAKVNEADLLRVLEHANRWEDISLSLFADRETASDEPGGLAENTLVGLGVSIPLPFWKQNNEAIELATIDRKAAEQKVDALRFQIRSEYEEAFLLRRDSYTLAENVSSDLVPLAEKNFSDLRLAYEQGQSSLTQVQLAQQQLIELRTAGLEAIASYHYAASKTRYTSGDYPNLNKTFPLSK